MQVKYSTFGLDQLTSHQVASLHYSTTSVKTSQYHTHAYANFYLHCWCFSLNAVFPRVFPSLLQFCVFPYVISLFLVCDPVIDSLWCDFLFLHVSFSSSGTVGTLAGGWSGSESELKTLVEEQPNSHFCCFEKMRAEVFHQLCSFISPFLFRRAWLIYQSICIDILRMKM